MIKHDDAFFDMTAGFDWDFMDYAFFPTRIKPMDIDGVVERNGRFLVFETKSDNLKLYIGTDKEMKDGQSRMYRALLDLKKGFVTIFFIEGKTPDTMKSLTMYYYLKDELNIKEIKPCTFIDIAYWTYRWFCRANGKEGVSKKSWIDKYNKYLQGGKEDDFFIKLMKDE